MGSPRQKGASGDEGLQLSPSWSEAGLLKEDRAAVKAKASDPKVNTNGIKFDTVNLRLKLTNT